MTPSRRTLATLRVRSEEYEVALETQDALEPNSSQRRPNPVLQSPGSSPSWFSVSRTSVAATATTTTKETERNLTKKFILKVMTGGVTKEPNSATVTLTLPSQPPAVATPTL
ncbi:hypothetical protein Pmani_034122 [Petrolisthes manimaculis]|uniref:Uncharacterized protein n=1 Tax=Petrolisthes manimaculis TaxID=1843537 RepID=A0AAE1TPH5_9EUCA|nr:hypothetical protein Pmani_034122 [Petrolisthes manimaculis]